MIHNAVEAGCDEAGRGPLAGPVFAAAVILPPDFHHPLLDDSMLYAQALQEADTPAKCLVCKDTIHSFIDFPDLEVWKDSMYAISTFIGGRAVSGIEILSKKDRVKLDRRQQLVVQ